MDRHPPNQLVGDIWTEQPAGGATTLSLMLGLLVLGLGLNRRGWTLTLLLLLLQQNFRIGIGAKNMKKEKIQHRRWKCDIYSED